MDGEMLPHVLISDIRRYVVAHLDDPGVVQPVFEYLELGMASERDGVDEMISVSFLECMDPAESAYELLRNAMGPNLRAQLEVICNRPARDVVTVSGLRRSGATPLFEAPEGLCVDFFDGYVDCAPRGKHPGAAR